MSVTERDGSLESGLGSGTDPAHDLGALLREWLTDHIMHMDR